MAIINGTSADDDLTGTGLADELYGLAGDDKLNGGFGADFMAGGIGDDDYWVDNVGDIVSELRNSGYDVVRTYLGSYELGANIEDLRYVGPSTGAFNGTGNALPNIIYGWNGNDFLNGAGGDDTMVGDDGDDTFVVDDPGDFPAEGAGAGNDLVLTYLAAYTLHDHIEKLAFIGNPDDAFAGTGNALGNEIKGWDGNDTLNGGSGADTLIGRKGDDLYYVDTLLDIVVEEAAEGYDTIRATAGFITLPSHVERLVYIGPGNFSGTGNSAANSLTGGAGADSLNGMAGADLMIGLGGDDDYKVDNLGDTVIEEAGGGTDTVYTITLSFVLPDHVEDLYYEGPAGSAFAGTGNALSNQINGWEGDDVLNGAGGGDWMIGGKGDDTYWVDTAGDNIFEEPGEGSDTVNATGASYVLPANVENLRYLGPSSGSFVGTGNMLPNRIEGWNGDDQLFGGGGADLMIGSLGDDLYHVDQFGDVPLEYAGEGIDTVQTAIGSLFDYSLMYELPAHIENLTGTSAVGQGVWGNSLNNFIQMGAGGDLVVMSGGGVDTVHGGGGDDFIYFGDTLTSADKADGGGGFDTLGLLGSTDVTFTGTSLAGIEKLAVYSAGPGNPGNHYDLTMHNANVAAGKQMMIVAQSLLGAETLTFLGGAEVDGSFNVRGGKGADKITGGSNADQIWGNLGADILQGGGGNDQFEYQSAAESTVNARDTIAAFRGGDRINLVAIDADGNAGNGNSAFTFIGATAFTGQAGQLRAFKSGADWIVEGDVNGDGVADLSILVQPLPDYMVTAADFFL